MNPARCFRSALASLVLCHVVNAAEIIRADICVYGGTAGGVAAAVQAVRLGKTAVMVEPGGHLGGMTSGGLGATDISNPAAIGGIAREFYHHVALYYANTNAWTFETAQVFFARHRGGQAALSSLTGETATMWLFEPRVAEDIFARLLNEAKVRVFFRQPLVSVKKNGARIIEIVASDKIFRAKIFIDASYEGDLMAKAGVSFTVGREADSQYNEPLNGVRAQDPGAPVQSGG